MDEDLSLKYIQTVRYFEGVIAKGCRYNSIDVTSSYFVVGTNVGTAYLFHRKSGHLQKLHCDVASQPVTCIRCLESVDLLIGIGTAAGLIIVFQYLPANDQMERYQINEVHSCPVRCLEWNRNGVKLFSGDENGDVAVTEMDYLMHLSKSVVLYHENYPVVQLVYYERMLLVSTKYRTFIAGVGEENSIMQVGQKERKSLGNFGAVFYGPPEKAATGELVIFASRPALRLWKANCHGKVLETYIFKDNSTPTCEVIRLGGMYTGAGILSPRPELQFGPIKVYKERYLLTWSYNRLMLLAVKEPSMIAKCDEFEDVRDVCSSGDEIYVLDGFRRITRISSSPDRTYITNINRDSFKFIPNPFKSLESNLKATIINKILPKSPLMSQSFRPNEESVNNEVRKVSNLEERVDSPSVLTDVEVSEQVIKDVAKMASNFEVGEKSLDSYWSPLSEGSDDNEDVSDVVYKRLPANKSRSRELLELKQDLPKVEPKILLEEINHERFAEPVQEAQRGTSPMPSGSREDKERLLAEILSFYELAPSSHCIPDSSTSSSDNLPNHQNAEVPVDAHQFIVDSFDSDSQLPHSSYDSIDTQDNGRYAADSTQPSLDYPDIYLRSNESYISYGPPSGSSVLTNNNSLSEAGSLPIPTLHSYNQSNEPKETVKLNYPPPLTSAQVSSSVSPPQSPEKTPVNEMSFNSGLRETADDSYNDTWIQHKPPAQIQCLAVCDTYMVCTDTKDVVYYSLFEGLGLEWHKTEYPAKQISISPSGKRVWRIYDHSAYALFEPSVRGPFGIRWMEVALDVQQISVHESCVWHVSSVGELFCQTGLKLDQTFLTLVNITCPSKIASVSCNAKSVLALTMEGELLWRTDIDEGNPAGKNWLPIKLDHGHVFAATLGNSIVSWIVDEAFDIWFLSCTKMTSKSSKNKYKWWQVKISDYIYQNTSTLQHLTTTLMDSLCTEQLTQMLGRINTGNVCLVSTENRGIWFYNPSEHKLLTNQREIIGHCWDVLENSKISGIRWKVFTASGVYQHHGGIWLWTKKKQDMICLNPTSMIVYSCKPPQLAENDQIKYLNAAPDAVWLLTEFGRIFIRTDIKANNCVGSEWVELDLTQITNHKLVHVCCGSNLVWAVDSKGVVLMRIGSLQVPSIRNFPPAWVVVDEEGNNLNPKTIFTKVYVGPLDYIVWAIDTKNNVYVREGIFPEILIGVGWVLVSGIQAESLSVSEQAVYALTPSRTIYRRYNITRSNYIGDYWKELPCPLQAKRLSVTVDDKLWALSLDCRLMQHSSCQVADGCQLKVSSRKSADVSIDDDWEVV